MIHVGVAEKLNDYAGNKNKAMDQILTRAKILKGHLLSKFIEQLEMQSTCSFHCMSWLLEENGACEYRTDCNVCIERFQLFDDLQAIVGSTKLPTNRKSYYAKEIHKIESNVRSYISRYVGPYGVGSN